MHFAVKLNLHANLYFLSWLSSWLRKYNNNTTISKACISVQNVPVFDQNLVELEEFEWSGERGETQWINTITTKHVSPTRWKCTINTTLLEKKHMICTVNRPYIYRYLLSLILGTVRLLVQIPPKMFFFLFIQQWILSHCDTQLRDFDAGFVFFIKVYSYVQLLATWLCFSQ